MPAGSNGKLFGAVTSQTLSDYFKNNGFEIERKRIEVPGLTIKNIGAYSFKVHLYEAAIAEVKLAVKAQPTEDNSKSSAKKDSKKQEKPAKEDDSAKAEDEASAEKND